MRPKPPLIVLKSIINTVESVVALGGTPSNLATAREWGVGASLSVGVAWSAPVVGLCSERLHFFVKHAYSCCNI